LWAKSVTQPRKKPLTAAKTAETAPTFIQHYIKYEIDKKNECDFLFHLRGKLENVGTEYSEQCKDDEAGEETVHVAILFVGWAAIGLLWQNRLRPLS